jgi:hypothetical protein
MRLYNYSFALRWMCLLTPALAALACGATNTPTPTAATPATVTESFSGAVAQQGTEAHSFTVSTAGSVQISLTSVEPLATMSLGVSIGSWNGTTCGAAIAKNDDARSGATALSGTATAGDYCVQVYDSGNIPESWSVSYTVRVAHP